MKGNGGLGRVEMAGRTGVMWKIKADDGVGILHPLLQASELAHCRGEGDDEGG